MTIINTNLPTATTPIQVNQDELSNQSPPKTVVLSDGRVLHLWTDYADHDHTSQMQLQGRIYNANGTPSTGQFELNSWRIDGFDGFDVDNLDVDVLTNGNVVIGYVRATDAVTHDYDEPVATIINPSINPGGNGFVVAQNIVIQQNDTTTYESPPVIEALADGRFMAVWSKNGAWDDTTEQPVMARIFNANGTPSTNEFVVGSWDVDGTDGYDMDNLTVTQLAGGNIVVAFERSYRENGGDEPVFAVLDSNGVAVRVDQEMQQNDTTTWESPPVVTALADGRFMAVWYKNGLHDNDNNMTLQGRIFNADGTPSTNEFRVGTLPVDGFDAYDTDNVVMTQLSNGNVVVGFVNNTNVDCKDSPHFSIINPSITPGGAGFAVISDIQINNDSTVYYAGPPVIQALANGNFVAVWVDGNVGEHSLPIKARIYDGNGNALSSEFLIVNRGDQGISTFDGFDWDNLNVVVQPDGKFVVSWVGQNDGSGTSVMTSGPIDPANFGVGSNIPNNLIVNGSFENVTGLTTTGYGFVGNGSVPSWTSANGSQIDIHNDKRGGINPADGNNWLDLEASPGNVRVGQNVQGVVSGNNYTLTFSAGDIANSDDGTSNDNTVTVYWGGQAIATINPNDGSMSQYQFNLVGGAGNGNNRLEFEGGGRLDNLGVSIDKVSLVANGSTPINNTGLIYYGDSNGNVGTLNPTTGANTVIGNSGKVFLDVAQNTSGQLFGVTNEGGTAKLYSINTSTGAASFLYNINNTFINSLTGDNANNLYAVSSNGALLRISASGAVTTLGNIGSSEGDLLVIGNNVYLSRADNVLVKYDLTTNQVSNVANLPEAIFGLAQNPNGNIYAIGADGKVYDVNPSTGSVTFTGADVNISGQVNGTASTVINTNPDAVDDTLVVQSSTSITIPASTLLANDTDPNGDTLRIVSVQGAQNGTVALVNGNVVFTPNPGYTGPAQFTYTITDSAANASTTLNFDNSVRDINSNLPSGWFTDNTSGLVEINTGTFYGTNNSSNVIELERNTGDAANLYTNVATTNGQPVTINFDYAARSGFTGSSAVNVLVNGNVIGTVNTGSTNFSSQSFSFTGNGGVMRVEFKATENNSTGGLLDNISISAPQTLSTDTAVVNLNITPSAPATPTVAADMTAPSDTGASNTDNITNDNTPSFVVANPSDLPVTLYVNGTPVASTYDPATNTVTPTNPIPDGSPSVTYALGTAPNLSGQSPALPVTIDTAAPAAPTTTPDMTAATDTGPSNTDNNTDDSTPDFAVTVPVGTTPSLYVDGVKVPATYNPSTGTLTPNSPIANGPHTVSYTLTDPAGNESAPSPALPVVIGSQSVAPATPTVQPDMTAPTDTGVSNSDNNTTDTTPDFAIPSPGGNTPNLYVDGVKVPATYNPTTGTLTPNSPISEGPHNLQYSLTNPQGQESGLSPALPILIDTQAPTQPATAPDMTAATDTGPSNTDNNTDDSTPDFAVTVPVGTTPSLYVDGVKVPATYNPSAGTLTPNSPIANGPHTVSYTLTDPAGNESAPSPALPFVIGAQSVAPVTPSVAPDMTAATDTGVSNTDNLTKDSTPDFAIPSPGSNTPNLYVDGVKVPATYNPTTGTLTPNSPISEGPHNLQYSLTNPQGQESGLSPALPILIDTQAPTQPATAPDMTAATDTGPSNTDNNTDDSTPDFAVTVPVGTTPSLYVDGVKVPATYNPSTGTLTPNSPIANGPHTVSYTLTDSAGNESAPSPALPVVIGSQSVAPATPTVQPDMTAPTDTGVSNSDNNTTDTTPDFAIPSPGGNTPNLYVDGVKVPATYNPTTGTLTPNSPISEGPHNLQYSLTNPQGQESGLSPALPILIDTQAPTQPATAPDMTAATDTGPSNTDNNTDDSTPDFAVTVPVGTTPSLYVDGVKVPATYNPSTGTLTPNSPIANGPHTVSYTLTDPAGNESAPSPALPVVIGSQSVAPATPTVQPDMTAPTDTGVSNSDNNTTDTTPDFAIPSPGGNTPNLYVDGVKVPATYNPTTGTLTPNSPISEGPHNLQYSLTNPQGQESGLSPALPILIDTQAPTQPATAPDMTAATDTGPSNTDNNTDDSTPDFAVTVPVGTTPSLYVDGVKVPATYNPSAGTLTPNSPIANGPHTVSYTLTDPAGNESAPSPALPFVIGAQSVAPVTPSVAPDMTAATDTGVSNTDNLTKDSTPDFAIPSPGSNTPNLYVDGVKVPSVYNPSTGTLTPVNPIGDGPHNLQYSLTNPQGQESGLSPALPVNIDTVAPAKAAPAPDMTAATDTGPSNTDNNTDDSTPDFTITVPVGNTPTLLVDGAKVPATYNPSTGILTPTNPISVGAHTISYVLTDAAGNESLPSDSLSVVIGAQIVNRDPNAVDDNISGTANTQVVIAPSTLLSNDSDVDGDTITGVSIQNAQNGQVYFDGTNVIFVPNTGYTGPASFTYTITDGKGAFDTATVNLNIAAPANTAPDAKDDAVSGTANTQIVISPSTLLSNDSDVDGDTITGVSIQNAQNGQVYWDGTNVIFVPNTGYTGPASFTYTITDGKGAFDTATVNLNIAAPANTAPDARDDVASGTRNNNIVISPASLLANDTDANGDTLVPISVQGAVNGVVSFDGTNIIFTPNTGYTGPASFTYTISDGKGGTDTATVNLTVAPPANTAPDARDDVGSGTRNTNIVISPASLLANDVDADGDTLTPINVGGAVNGVVTFDGTNIIFTPNTGYTGPASFTYTISDGKGGTDTATVNLTVAPPANTAPDARDDVGSGTRNTNIVISPASLLANDVDADGDTLTPINVGGAVNGVVTFDGTNIIFTPNTGYTGPASFTYTVSDGKGGTDTATVNLTVAPPANTAPDARDDSGIFGFRDTNLTIAPSTLLANDVDADGDTITPINLQDAVNGQVFFDGVNVIFVPNSGYTGPASFTYTVSDGKGGTDTATVNLNIGSKIIGTENDFLEGTSGNDYIDGLSGDDILIGNEGNDILIGGKGSDTMTGGTGNDVFTFKLGDASASEVEIDTIKDFQVGDVLNLKDLLQGESSNAASLDNYLHFNFENNSTVISVSTNGQANAGVVDQKIVLENVDLTAGNTLTDLQVIQNLLSNNAISTD